VLGEEIEGEMVVGLEIIGVLMEDKLAGDLDLIGVVMGGGDVRGLDMIEVELEEEGNLGVKSGCGSLG